MISRTASEGAGLRRRGPAASADSAGVGRQAGLKVASSDDVKPREEADDDGDKRGQPRDFVTRLIHSL